MLTLKTAEKSDILKLYEWANDEGARANSYNSSHIPYNDHVVWFNKKIEDPLFLLYIFSDATGNQIGYVRFDCGEDNAIISIAIDKNHRGKGYAVEMINMATNKFRQKNDVEIWANIFKTNGASYKSFLKSGYKPFKEEKVRDIDSYILIKR